MPTIRGRLAAASVKNKLLALFGCILAGYCLIFVVNLLSSRRIAHTLKLERLATAAALNVLSMRRQEKNYFLRHDTASFTAVRRYQQAAVADVEAIGSLDPQSDTEREAALHLLQNYRDGFQSLDETAEDVPVALFLERSQSLDRIEAAPPSLTRGLALLRIQEKRWLASDAPADLTRLQADATRLAALARAQDRPDAGKALDAYRTALTNYATRLHAPQSPSAVFVAAARALEPVTSALRRRYEERQREISREADMLITSIEAGVIVLVALVAWAVFRSVTAPLEELGRHARRVSRGEATNLDPTAFSGEFRELAQDIVRMENHLLATILDLARKEHEAAEEADQAHQARKRAEELSRVKSNFLSLVSHEFKTPLTSMIGFAQVMKKRLERGLLAEAARINPALEGECARFVENLGIMLDEGRRLTELIDNVLELASLESGDTPLAMGPAAADAVIARAVEPFLPAMADKGLRFVRDIPNDLPPLRCDQERMIYVLHHLFSNAVKFTDAGQVTCRVRRKGDFAVIDVEDTGRGIPAEMEEAVFEKFLQLGDGLTGKMPGLGIGLAASRAVIEHHGGSIRIAGQPGRGSIVSVSVPLAAAA